MCQIGKKIIVASLNPTKVKAVESLFPKAKIEAVKAPSKVLKQPISNEMTRMGAVNRARYALQLSEGDASLAFEGGVCLLNEELYLCNWGALLTAEGELFTASGGLITLPSSFIQPIFNGEELGSLMEAYTAKPDLGSKEGAIGVFTANFLTREEVYRYIGQLLLGQFTYSRALANSGLEEGI